MKIFEDKDVTLWECDLEGCNAQAGHGHRPVNERVIPYDWAEIRRHTNTYHFCFRHGIDLFKHITLKERA